MEFDNTLEVPLSPAEAWKVLLDVKRIATCIPGAQLTEVVDENTYKGKVAVRLGPVALSLAGYAKFEEIDHANRKARMKAHGSDPKGRGSSDSTIDFHLEPSGAGTRVLVHSDVKLSGSIAQYGRGSGMIQSFAQQLIAQFGENLKAQLAQSPPVAPPPSAPLASSQETVATGNRTPPLKPISGLTLLWKAFRESLARRFSRGPTRP